MSDLTYQDGYDHGYTDNEISQNLWAAAHRVQDELERKLEIAEYTLKRLASEPTNPPNTEEAFLVLYEVQLIAKEALLRMKGNE
jgi:hypothetical protein